MIRPFIKGCAFLCIGCMIVALVSSIINAYNETHQGHEIGNDINPLNFLWAAALFGIIALLLAQKQSSAQDK